jgi:hypothetical protein
MQVYYFYQHPTEHHIFVQKELHAEAELEFLWVDCTRDDVVNRADAWQKKFMRIPILH